MDAEVVSLEEAVLELVVVIVDVNVVDRVLVCVVGNVVEAVLVIEVVAELVTERVALDEADVDADVVNDDDLLVVAVELMDVLPVLEAVDVSVVISQLYSSPARKIVMPWFKTSTVALQFSVA